MTIVLVGRGREQPIDSIVGRAKSGTAYDDNCAGRARSRLSQVCLKNLAS